MKVDKINEKFQTYCNPRKNVTYERHVFNKRSQHTGESVDKYVTELKTLAKSCEFGDLNDSLIKDRIVCSIQDDAVRARLLRIADLNLSKTIDTCRSSEVSTSQISKLKEQERADIHTVQKTKHKPRPKFQKRASQSTTPDKKTTQSRQSVTTPKGTCLNCGGSHNREERCPAKGVTCYKCQKIGHYANVCLTTKYKQHAKQVHAHEVANTEVEEDFFIGAVNKASAGETDWNVTLNLNDTPVKFKIDTGAECNVIPVSMLEKIGASISSKAKVRLDVYGGTKITTMGQVTLACLYRSRYTTQVFEVVKEEAPCLLGRKTSEDLPPCEKNLCSKHRARRLDEAIRRCISRTGAHSWRKTHHQSQARRRASCARTKACASCDKGQSSNRVGTTREV